MEEQLPYYEDRQQEAYEDYKNLVKQRDDLHRQCLEQSLALAAAGKSEEHWKSAYNTEKHYADNLEKDIEAAKERERVLREALESTTESLRACLHELEEPTNCKEEILRIARAALERKEV